MKCSEIENWHIILGRSVDHSFLKNMNKTTILFYYATQSSHFNTHGGSSQVMKSSAALSRSWFSFAEPLLEPVVHSTLESSSESHVQTCSWLEILQSQQAV